MLQLLLYSLVKPVVFRAVCLHFHHSVSMLSVLFGLSCCRRRQMVEEWMWTGWRSL